MTHPKVHILLTGKGWGYPAPVAAQVCQPTEILQTHCVDEVVSMLQEVELRSQDGYFAIGFVCYEAAAAFDLSVYPPQDASLPLLWFAIVDPNDWRLTSNRNDITPPSLNAAVRFHESADDFSRTVRVLKQQIQEGNTYQVNYTLRASVETTDWTPEHFFAVYHSQPVPYAAYVETVDWTVLSFSPECFLSRTGRRITSIPMKGTHRRGRYWDEDRVYQDVLKNSLKDRAENIMITDMVRHDLGKISEWGSVRVSNLFQIEPYRTVLQMTSRVHAKLKPQIGLVEIFQAAFPAASITGAPKHRTMQLIREYESSPRGVYCGALGVIQPGGDFTFNVAIRTIVCRHKKSLLGVGGGIVWDSSETSEYEEIQTKTRFLTQITPPFQLIETMKVQEDHTVLYIKEHLDRLQTSAAYFSYPFHRQSIRIALEEYAAALHPPCVLRLLLDEAGKVSLSSRPMMPIPPHPEIILSKHPIDSSNPFFFHKTTQRNQYQREREQALHRGKFEVIFQNELGYITEGTVTNLLIYHQQQWKSPPITDGLLAGIWRKQCIRDFPASETQLTPADLLEAERILVGNSVIGGIEVTLSKPDESISR